MNTFLIVDDHALFRGGLKRLLGDEFKGCQVLEAATVEEGIQALRAAVVDLVLLDVNLGGRSGFDFIRAARVRWPATPVVVVSMYSAEQYASLAIRRGAAGYVCKASATEDLVKAIQRALSGQITCIRVPTHCEPSPHFALSPREQELMRLLIAGHSIGDAAERMSISAKTVSTHRVHLFEKLGVRNSIELALYAVREGLLIS